MSKHLPLNLAQHPLLIQAFTGEDGKFTTEKVWADDPKEYLWGGVDVQNRKEVETELSCALTNRLQIAIHDTVKITAPAADLEELLTLGSSILKETGDEKLWDILETIHFQHFDVGGETKDRLTRLAEAIIAVLEERQ